MQSNAFFKVLVQQKCNFHLVFIDAHQNACIPPGIAPTKFRLYPLARSIIIRHLKAHLPRSRSLISLRIFDSVHNPQLDDYLKTSGIYFVLCHDRASSAIDFRMWKPDKSVNNVLFRGIVYSFMTRGYNVALVNGLEWIDTKVRFHYDS